MMNIRAYNREAWNREVESGNVWTIPVTPETVHAARQGDWHILLTPTKRVPRTWFPPLQNLQVLCLASGGGQQGPVLAAAGAKVTVFDNSPKQLAQDRLVAEREHLELELVEGDMADLSVFANESFDLIVHPCSNVFVPEVKPVWQETYRVLRHGGALLAGFVNPMVYIFDLELAEQGKLDVRYSLPYSDLEALSAEQLQQKIERGEPLEFSHSLADQIGGQIRAGFVIAGFYEDYYFMESLGNHLPTMIATRGVKT